MKAGYVVYAPFETSGKISTFRVESLGKGRVSQQVVKKTDLSVNDFTTYLSAAGQPNADSLRERLRKEVVPENPRDNGKNVLFKDLALFGISPSVLGRTDDDILVASDLPKAASNLKLLDSTNHADANYVGIFGFPSTDAEYTAMFEGNGNVETLEKWRLHKAKAEDIAKTFDVHLIEGVEADANAAKQKILRQFEQADGILFVIAHANGCRILLPGGGQISITPDDIANLNLAKNPFVVLRVCQPSDHGFAKAFIQAGARGVWMNRGIIDAGIATSQVEAFLKEIRSGKTIGKTIRGLRANDKVMKTSTHIVVQEIRNGNIERSNSNTLDGVRR